MGVRSGRVPYAVGSVVRPRNANAAVQSHPNVVAAEAQRGAAIAKVRSVRAQGWPTLSMVGQMSYSGQPVSASLGQPELPAVTLSMVTAAPRTPRNWSRWADRAVRISAIDRAAAGDMSAKGVTYPQDFVVSTFTRTEKWGLLEVMYLFSPDAEGISSRVALSVTDTDWTPANVSRYPEKVAYIDKQKAWGMAFWPKFKTAFDEAASPGK
jgi:hypothetical protein